jgi:hypothetical protein
MPNPLFYQVSRNISLLQDRYPAMPETMETAFQPQFIQVTPHLTAAVHFHIHWNGKDQLDWEAFNSHEDAFRRAIQLANYNESFSIEECRDKCCPLKREDQE